MTRTSNNLVHIREGRTVEPSKLYSRNQFKWIEGIFMDPSWPNYRYVSDGAGNIFIFGDPCLMYKTGFANCDEVKYVQMDEVILFTSKVENQ